MLRARDVIMVAGLIAVLSVLMSVISLMGPPDGDGWGGDSYGTHARGQRALYELLGELGVPVSRRLSPPTGLPVGNALLVLMSPHAGLVAMEPAYLHRLREWLASGGEILLAMPSKGLEPFLPKTGADSRAKVSITDALAIAGVNIKTVDVIDVGQQRPAPDRAGLILKQDARPLIQVEARGEGDLAGAASDVRRLSVPLTELAVIDDKSTATAQGLLRIQRDKQSWILAASYRVGKGRLVLVADPAVFLNEALGADDNAVLAARLLSRPGRQVVFDEFYHGLTVRGNPLWLLTRFPYGLLALLTLTGLGLWAWRAAAHLGPPLPDPVAERRSIAEYVNAMGRLFTRAGSRRHLMILVRDGTLWMLRRQFNMAPGDERPERLLASIARRDPERAARLHEALAAADRVILSERKPDSQELIQTAGKVIACL